MSEQQAAVAEPVEQTTLRPKEKKRRKTKRQPRYNVLLWDDNDHTHAYVIAMMQTIFGYPAEQGYKIAHEVDTRGKAIVLTTTLEHAELKRDQIHAFGKDDLIAGCKGSMWSTLEPVE